MEKNMKTFLISMLLLVFFIASPFKVNADSGFDAKYDSSSSDLIGSVSSVASPAFKLIVAQPNEPEYETNHIIIAIICIIMFYIFTNIYMFKLNDKKKKAIVILMISLIPTSLFSIFCLLPKLQLFLYIIVLVIYIIIFKITTKKIIKKRTQRKIDAVIKIDKGFDINKLNEETFEIYKKIQLAWMNFELNIIKNLVSDKMFNKYKEQLDALKKDNRKNVMDKIEFKSNEILDIKIENNIEIIECKMSVTCYDYIVNSEDKVIKGKKDKKHNYTYKLVFHKKIDMNKYILVEKKILKQN